MPNDRVNKKSFKYSGFVRGVIFRNNKILLLKENRYGNIVRNLPGGKIEENESPEQAIYREVKEEIGIECSISQLIFSDNFIFDNKMWKGWYFKCLLPHYNFNLECNVQEAKFFDISNIFLLHHGIPNNVLEKLIQVQSQKVSL